MNVIIPIPWLGSATSGTGRRLKKFVPVQTLLPTKNLNHDVVVDVVDISSTFVHVRQSVTSWTMSETRRKPDVDTWSSQIQPWINADSRLA